MSAALQPAHRPSARNVWVPPGPVSAAYYASRAFINLIMGPVGSAKTTTTFRKLLAFTPMQAPSPVDGVRRCSVRVIRDTYRNVRSTALPSWHKILPPSFGHYVGGGPNDPASHVVRWDLPDGTKAELALTFIGVGELSADDVFSGWEGTWAYFNELTGIDPAVFLAAIARVGRYPGGDHGPCTAPYGILADFNAPSATHWLCKLVMKIRSGQLDELLRSYGIDPADLVRHMHSGLASFFRQPGGFEPGAENLENLPGGRNYYIAQKAAFAMAGDDALITTKIDNEFGPSRHGKPVYPRFKDAKHVAAKPLDPLPGVPVIIGADGGLKPGVVFTQEDADGRILVLDELVPREAEVWDALEISTRINRVLKSARYRDLPASGTCDPTNSNRSGADASRTWLSIVRSKTGIPWREAPTNSPILRVGSVNSLLVRDGGLLVSPVCEILIDGFNFGYRLAENDGAEMPLKDKNYSGVHDALQYACLGHGLHVEVLRGQRQAGSSMPIIAPHAFNPLA